MSLPDQSFSNYSINNNEISLEENNAVSLFNEQEHQQCQIPQDQDLFFPQLSSQYHEFILHEEEEESRHPSLENLTQSILDYQNLINDEKPLSQTIQPVLEQNKEPKNKQDISQLIIIQKETTNTSLTKPNPYSTIGNEIKLLGRKRREDKGKSSF